MDNNKKIIIGTAIGAGLEFLVVLLTGIFGVSPIISGLIAAIKEYGALIALSDVSAVGIVSMIIMFLAGLLLVINIVKSVKGKKPLLILTAVCLFLAMAFVPFLLMLTFPQLDAGNIGRKALCVLSGLLALNLVAVILLSLPLKQLRCCCKAQKEEAPVQQQQPVQEVVEGLSEEEVKSIVEQYLADHVGEMHQQKEEEPAPAPVKEEPAPVEEEEELDDSDDEEEEEEEEEVEVVDEATGQTIKIKRKKRVPFERKLRNSEFDLRHKYYDLRDYIKWYGLNNRISIPGDSFSLKRRKYAFITIVGKHIKFYVALDPDKYENSPIPVERATAKKYIDTPCVLRIKSDLAYRRAKQLVDDCMKQAGIAKPEGEEPKETQHPEK